MRNPGRGRRGRSGRGRSGRGKYTRTNSFRRRNNNFSNSSQTKEYKFHPHTQGKQQYASYASIKEIIIQNIQRSWEGGYDIAKSLRDLIIMD